MTVKNFKIPSAVYFIVTALLIAYFFPREGKFRYQFFEGKPWKYGLLTAPSNFPIYKTDKEVALEKDSVLKDFKPYYKINRTIEAAQKEKLRKDYATTLKHIAGSSYMQYIEHSLSNLYARGIVSYESLNQLNKDNYAEINVVENNVSKAHFVSDLFTVKTAYEFIINNCPPRLDKKVLKACDINNYLVENVSYDSTMTARVKDELLQNVSLASGMVQAGERIVDRGEIIDGYTYNVLRSLKIVYENKTGGNQRMGMILGGQFVLVMGIMLCMWLYLWSFRVKIFHNQRSVIFLLLTIIVPCLLTEFCVTYGLFNVYILPYAIAPIVVRTFFDSRTALFMHLVTILLCSLMVPFPHEFLLLQTVAGMVVTFSLKELSERSQLIRSSVFIFIAYVIIYLSLAVYQEADFQKINWMMLLYFGINFILLTFAYLLVYMLEKTFGYVSSITLVELSNINNPLLKSLSETCPGTFQHSLHVSILAADAASRVGANSQLVRTGALYHDIGKMSNPAFFTENQSSVNPHEKLSLDESAQIIISHVTEGVKIAEKAMLPKAIINFIRTHHGNGKAKYFYNSLKNLNPDQEIDESLFTYPGPNPFTKETAILMMADAVEATSRSLKEYTEENIKEVVNRIVEGQIADGLLRNTPLTYRDVETIKNVFCEKLKTMYHTRISYPDLKK